jgi:hypothetical protein
MTATVEFKKGKLTETDYFENITNRGLKLKIAEWYGEDIPLKILKPNEKIN